MDDMMNHKLSGDAQRFASPDSLGTLTVVLFPNGRQGGVKRPSKARQKRELLSENKRIGKQNLGPRMPTKKSSHKMLCCDARTTWRVRSARL